METRKARVVGEVTALGYLFCVACHPNAGEETGSTAVYAGSPPHSEEECDLCHRVLEERTTDRRPLLDANSANPLEASIARLRSEDGTELLVRIHPQTVPTTAAPFHSTATHVDALGMPVAFTEYGSYHPTPCCGAAASISDGPMYCKACYAEVDPAFGNVPVEPFRLISETEQA